MSSNQKNSNRQECDHPPHKRVVNLRLLAATLVILGVFYLLANWWYRLQLERTSVALLARADALESTQEWSKVANALQRYLLLHPGDSAVRIRTIEVYAKAAETARDKQRLIQYLYQAIGLNPERSDLQLQLAENLLQLGEFAAAEKEARKLVMKESENASAARRVIALSLVARARPDGNITPKQTIIELNKALTYQPGDIKLASTAADFLHRYPDSLEEKNVVPATYADQIIDRMVEANPGNPDALVARYTYAKRHIPAKARESDLKTALELNPNHVEALLLAANRAIDPSTGINYDTAMAYLRRVIESQPEDQRGYLAYAQLLSQSGDHETAKQVLHQGCQAIGENHIELLSALIAVLIDNNELDSADKYLQQLEKNIRDRLLQLSKNAKRSLDNRLRLLHARIAFGRKQWNLATSNLKVVVTAAEREDVDFLFPDTRQAIFLLGQVMAVQKQWNMAAHYWTRLVNKVPQQFDLWRLAGHAYLQAGQPDTAIDCLERFLQKSPSSKEILVDLVQAHLQRQLRRSRSERNWTEFLSLLKEAKKQDPDHWELFLAEANHLLNSDAADAQQRVLAILRTCEEQYAEDSLFWSRLVLFYGQLGETEDAERALQRFEALESSKVDRVLLRTDLLIRTDRIKEADELLVRLIPGLSEAERIQIDRQRVRIAVAASKFDDAKELITKLINAAPSDEDLLKIGMEVALMAKDLQSAKKWEASLSRLDLSNDFEFRVLRARRLLEEYTNLETQERTNLEHLVTTLRSEQPNSFIVVTIAARHAELQGNNQKAITDYQRAIELGDGRMAVLERLVSLLYGEKRYQEAYEFLSRLMEASPNNSVMESMAISIAYKQDQPEEAMKIAKAAVEKNPDDAMRRVWLGNLLSIQGEEEEAERVFRAALERFPKDHRLLNGLFALLVKTKKNDAARQVLNAMVDQPSWPDVTRLFVKAQGYERLGDVDQARKCYETGIQIDPNNTAIRLGLARVLFSTDVNAARKQLEQILQLDPKNNEARQRLAALLSSSGSDEDWNRALELLGQGQGTGASAAVDDRLRAVILWRRGRTREERLAGLEAAREILLNQVERTSTPVEDIDRILLAGVYEEESHLRNNPALLEAARGQLRYLVDRMEPQEHYLVMYVQFLLRQIKSPLLTAEESTNPLAIRTMYLKDARLRLDELHNTQKRSKGTRETLLSLGLQVDLMKAEGQNDEAATLIGEFAKQRNAEIDKDVDRARLYLGVGYLYSSIGREEEAETWYRQLTAIVPSAYVLLVQSLSKQNRVQDALEVCLRESQKNASPELVIIVAKLLMSSEIKSQTNENAQKLISSAIDSHGDNVELLSAVAVLHASRGKNDEAIRLFRQVLELAPNDTLAMNNLATLLAEDSNQYAEATEWIEKAISMGGRSPALLDTQGTIYLRSGHPDKAILCLEEATAGSANDPRYFFHLAAAYHEIGKTKAARDAFAKALEYGLERSVLTTADQDLLTQLRQELLLQEGHD
ncbi:MAG: tetratricopeptide repeat protein [Pirellulales bacterium]|nr:tetratricopeptide repeat protein [Pirellulales bacterium]